jgi:peptide/nickel transport system permease protein
VIRRLVAAAALVLILSFGIFALVYIAPGSVEQAILGTRPVTPAAREAVRHQFHLDEPFWTQYWIWLRDALQLHFGTSIRTSEPVITGIRARMGLTFFLGLYAFALTMIFGIGLGVLAAVRKRRGSDRAIVALSVVGVSTPPFVSAVILLYLFAVRVSWFPAFGAGSGFWGRLVHLTLPAAALALTAMALVVKLTRASMIAALEQDYVTFARARGVPYRRVLFAYAFRNALVPIVTAGGTVLGFMLTGAVLVEVAFALPGVGSLLVDSVTFSDVPMIQGVAMAVALLIILVNLLTDIAYVLVDPRIRFGSIRE